MKKLPRSLFCSFFAAALPVLLFTGCVEQSIVIKVKKDGSGIVHERSYTNDAMGQMFAGGLGGEEGEVEVESTTDIPTEDELKEIASKMGEGVTFKTVKEGKNRSGWGGYEVIYAFTDINKLKVDMNDFNPQDEEDAEDASAETSAEEAEEVVTFEMTGNTLKIITPDPAAGLGGGESEEGESGISGGADDPFAGMDASDPQAAMAFQMMAGMAGGMRMGLFVMPDDPITSTNAKHQNGNMITLMMMDMGKIFQNQENLAKMQKMQSEKDRDALQEVADGIDGMTVDLQSPIVVEFE